jgi:hypothetical protein
LHDNTYSKLREPCDVLCSGQYAVFHTQRCWGAHRATARQTRKNVEHFADCALANTVHSALEVSCEAFPEPAPQGIFAHEELPARLPSVSVGSEKRRSMRRKRAIDADAATDSRETLRNHGSDIERLRVDNERECFAATRKLAHE